MGNQFEHSLKHVPLPKMEKNDGPIFIHFASFFTLRHFLPILERNRQKLDGPGHPILE